MAYLYVFFAYDMTAYYYFVCQFCCRHVDPVVTQIWMLDLLIKMDIMYNDCYYFFHTISHITSICLQIRLLKTKFPYTCNKGQYTNIVSLLTWLLGLRTWTRVLYEYITLTWTSLCNMFLAVLWVSTKSMKVQDRYKM